MANEDEVPALLPVELKNFADGAGRLRQRPVRQKPRLLGLRPVKGESRIRGQRP